MAQDKFNIEQIKSFLTNVGVTDECHDSEGEMFSPENHIQKQWNNATYVPQQNPFVQGEYEDAS